MSLRKEDNLGMDTRREKNISCPSAEVNNLWEFFSTDNYEKYKMSTLCDAHSTTQALLSSMYKDLNITDDKEDNESGEDNEGL